MDLLEDAAYLRERGFRIYYYVEMGERALVYYNRAIKLNPQDDVAYSEKKSYSEFKRKEERSFGVHKSSSSP